MPEHPSRFFVAPFGIDGEPEGMGCWEIEKLSPKWLAICDQHLELHGTSFDAPWSGNLAHIEMKFTSGSGAALVTFSVHGKPAASVVLASGRSPAADADVIKMFVDSLRKVALLRQPAASPNPFHRALAIEERPLMIVVPWPEPDVSEEDHALVRELAVHTAGAFFARGQRPS